MAWIKDQDVQATVSFEDQSVQATREFVDTGCDPIQEVLQAVRILIKHFKPFICRIFHKFGQLTLKHQNLIYKIVALNRMKSSSLIL